MSKASYLAVVLLLAAYHVDARESDGKVLSFFNVVKFPNDLCDGSGTRNGTCYTAEECEDRKGTAEGSCADGFGVCCIIQLDCGGTSSQNNTYFVKPSFTIPTDADRSCHFDICPASSSICRIRMDFTTFVVAGTSTATIGVATIGPSVGDCNRDSFSAPGAPVICGTNTGQHMYLDSDGHSCAHNTFTFNGDTVTRQLDIMVMQYDCNDNAGGPEGCLQYFTADTGTIRSYNFVLTAGAIAIADTKHLSNQDYDICIRRNKGFCSICYIAEETGSPAFGLSVSSAAIALGSVDAACLTDYIEIPNGQSQANAKMTATQTATGDRFCGRFLGPATGATASASVCSSTRPFKIAFHSDGDEVISTVGAATTDELHLAPFGTVGFSLQYAQQTC